MAFVVRPIPVIRHNPLNIGLMLGLKYAPSNIGLTKYARYEQAKADYERYKRKYNDCKVRRKAKGKPVWPHQEKRTIFTSDCRPLYEAMKRWEVQVASNATAAMGKDKRKGAITDEKLKEYMLAIGAPAATSEKEYNAAMDEYDQKLKKLEQQLENKNKTLEELRSQAGPEPDPNDFVANESDSTMLYVAAGLGVLLVGGGAAIYYVRKKRQSKKTSTGRSAAKS